MKPPPPRHALPLAAALGLLAGCSPGAAEHASVAQAVREGVGVGPSPIRPPVSTRLPPPVAPVAGPATDPLPSETSVSANGELVNTLALEVPAGRAGLAPSLALRYATNRPNGVVGVGFALDAGSEIRRCRRTWAVDGRADGVDFDATDALCLDGERLVAVGAGPRGSYTEYRTREDQIARVLAYGPASSPTSFTVWLKSGRVRRYETPVAAHRCLADGTFVTDVGVVTTGWLLTTEEDRSGNLMRYAWQQVASPAWPFGVETLLQSIEYTARSGEPGRRRVEFTYEARPDAITSFESGTRREIKRRLRAIEMYAPNPGATALVWRYTLGYELSAGTGRSRLASVQRCGALGGCSLARSFRWQHRAGLPLAYSTYTEPRNVSAFLTYDVNADGRDDVVYEQQFPGGEAPRVYLRRGQPVGAQGFLTTSSDVSPQDGNLGMESFYVGSGRPVDANNDGHTLLKARAAAPSCRVLSFAYHEDTGAFTWSPGYLCSLNHAPAFDYLDADGDGRLDTLRRESGAAAPWSLDTWNAPPVDTGLASLPACGSRGADLDGDGRAEMIVSSAPGCTQGLALGLDDAGDVTAAPTVGTRDPSGSSVVLADLNGDGLPEAIWPRSQPEMQWNSGNGFGPRIELDPWLSNAVGGLPVSAYDLVPADLDGDGRQDLILQRRVAAPATWALLSRGSNGTFEHIDLGLTPGELLRVADFNGDGRLDLATASGHELRLALQRGDDYHEVDVLVTATDGPAIATPRAAVTYGRSPNQSAPAAVCAWPQDCLRYGLRVVRSVSGLDLPAARHYAFRDPRLDLSGAGFLGFGEVREWIPARPAEIVTTYDHAAASNGVFAGARRPAAVTTVTPILEDGPNGPAQWGVAPARVKAETFTYAVRWLHNNKTYFVRPQHTFSREWEEPVDIDWTPDAPAHVTAVDGGATLRTRTIDQTWDDFANELTTLGVTAGGDRSLVTRAFDNITLDWRVGLLRTEDTAAGPVSLPLPTARRRELDYDARGRLTETRLEPANPDLTVRQTVQMTVDADGNVRALASLAPGSATRTRHQEFADFSGERVFVSQTWNDLGHATGYLYHPAFGVALSTLDPNGVVAETHLDDLGRVVFTGRAGDAAVTTARELVSEGNSYVGSRTTETSATGAVRATRRDLRGRVVEERRRAFDGQWSVRTTGYDVFDRVVAESLPGLGAPGAVTVTVYNSLDRKLRASGPEGTAHWSYPTFTTIHSTDAEGRARDFENDLEDRLARSTSYAGGAAIDTAYGYGAFGLLRTVTDHEGHVVTMGYDARGRRTSLLDPDLGATTTLYDGHGEVRATTNAAGEVTTYTRDALGRATTVTGVDGAATFAWDASPHGVGSLSYAVSPSGVREDMTYDAFGRLERTATTVGAAVFAVDLAYDVHGRVATRSYPEVPGRARFAVRHAYAPHGALAEVSEVTLVNGQPALRSLWRVDARTADDLLAGATYGNGVVESRTYDPLTGRLAVISAGAQAQVYGLIYGRDHTGKVTDRLDTVAGRGEHFVYDGSHRLRAWEVTRLGATRATAYAYDPLGNLEQVQVDGATVETHTYDGPTGGAHALTGGTLGAHTYDARGRLTSGGGRSFTWTGFDLPAQITAPQGVTQFAYDAEGRRARKTLGAEESVYVGGVYERRTTAQGVSHVFRVRVPDGEVAQVVHDGSAADRTLYVVGDHLDSVGVVTDDVGAVSERVFFDPFGRRVDASGAPPASPLFSAVSVGFTGHSHDDELDLIDMGGRVYSPVMRRFLSPDPVVALPEFGQALNRYSYVMNDPVNLIDPTGYEVIEGECGEDNDCGTNHSGSPGDALASEASSEGDEGGQCSEADQPNSSSMDQAAAAEFSSAIEQGAMSTSGPADATEREADRAAESVTGSAVTSGDQGSAASTSAGVSDSEGQRTADRSTGAPSASATGATERSFGRDFRAVRTGSGEAGGRRAGTSDAVLGAHSEATVFGAGAYGPHASSGDGLLAHELAHVAQQSRAPR